MGPPLQLTGSSLNPVDFGQRGLPGEVVPVFTEGVAVPAQDEVGAGTTRAR